MYTWPGKFPYNDYTTYIKTRFAYRVQKISINAGFTCPNRDGKISTGGCTYCNNNTFSPFYCAPEKSITRQLNEGIDFFKKKYESQKYLAYFQAYTNTYGNINEIKHKYEEALAHPDVIGLVIATRADCIDETWLNYFSELAKKYYISVEYGIESTLDSTLQRINRGHNYQCSADAVKQTAEKKIYTGAHIILGLPGENKSDMIQHAEKLSQLPLHTLKIHQLQIVKGTRMAEEYMQNINDFNLFNVDDYVELVIDFTERLNPQIIVERFCSESPQDLIIAPNWNGIKNYVVLHKIRKRMMERNTWQGKFFEKNY